MTLACGRCATRSRSSSPLARSYQTLKRFRNTPEAIRTEHGLARTWPRSSCAIGKSFFIDHGTGVVIGGTAVIGKRVRIYQAVTLGAKSFPQDEHGVLVKGKPRHPIVEDDVVIYAGATILGRVSIGKGSQIGGNVWLTTSVPPETIVTQAKVVSETFGEGGGI